MFRLRGLWREGPPEVLILGGTSTGLVANASALAIALAVRPMAMWAATLAVFGGGMGLAILAVVILSLRASRTSRNFVYVGAVASALTVLSVPGLIGGTIALIGAAWGVVQTYKPNP